MPTVGLFELLNFELVFAGGIYYLKDDLFELFDRVIHALKN